MTAKATPGRLAYVDSLRGIAALLVVLMHNVQPVATAPVRTLIFDVIDLGKVGVIMFFAISGFVIPFSFPNGAAPIRRFAISRLFRLYPAYWFSIAAYLALILIAAAPFPPAADILANLTMAQTAMGQPNLIGVYWTLFIELIFYMLCALAFAAGLLRKARFTLVACITCLGVAALFAVARFHLERKVPVALPLSLSVMFWGTLWREAIVNGSEKHRRFAIWTLLLYIAFIPPISLLAYNIDLGLEENWVRYMSSYLVALAIFVALTTAVRISSRLPVWLGAISYSLYLFHVHARDAVRMALASIGAELPVWTAVLLSVAVAVAAAWVIYTLVERPMIMLGRRVADAVAIREQRRMRAQAIEGEFGT
ncbi:acyltransferase family protein [Inquilinus limosus]|uniref:acyltransferase family protein n=1 Tax=Inquilinus limosus TaxID=171674 RepID=UPI000685EDDB|nr:acyltransferase [Inquilinus limosus]